MGSYLLDQKTEVRFKLIYKFKAGTIHTRCVLSRPLLDKYERLNDNDSDCKFLIDTRTVPLKVVMYEKTNPTSFELFEQQFSSKTLFYCLL